jgi:hypothetical protein
MTDMRGKACLFSLAGTSPLFFSAAGTSASAEKVGHKN